MSLSLKKIDKASTVERTIPKAGVMRLKRRHLRVGEARRPLVNRTHQRPRFCRHRLRMVARRPHGSHLLQRRFRARRFGERTALLVAPVRARRLGLHHVGHVDAQRRVHRLCALKRLAHGRRRERHRCQSTLINSLF